MTFTELENPDELTDFLNENSEGCIIAFSATWCGKCLLFYLRYTQDGQTIFRKNSYRPFYYQSVEIGPCKATKPQLMEWAATSPIPIGYVYEENLEDFLDIFVQISGFPTYILFQNGQEKARVEGTNFAELEQMIHNHNTASA